MARIIIIHYHLNPGGVTRIIESQAEGIASQMAGWECVVLTGAVTNPDKITRSGATLIVDERLNYLTNPLPSLTGRLQELEELIEEQLAEKSVIHFHNMNLGKNPLLTVAVSRLAGRGIPVINHAHDFSEDRPANQRYLKEIITDGLGLDLQAVMYPPVHNLMFLTLNSADYNRLIQMGVSSERVQQAPNPVTFSAEPVSGDPGKLRRKVLDDLQLAGDKKLITYPVRVIQRKNIGEFILLAVLFASEAHWIVTQPPKNPVEVVAYQEWKNFCLQENIPVVFEAGQKTKFLQLVQASDWCFTTSIREGFGMSYMEPWLLGTPVAGRNLPNITPDLTESGMRFPLLYDRLLVPWKGDRPDFPELEQHSQAEFIRNLKNSEDLKKAVLKMNPALELLEQTPEPELIMHNQHIILTEYSLTSYAKRLKGIYQKIAG